MAFTPEQIAEIDARIRAVLNSDGKAMDNDTDVVPITEASEITDAMSFPLIQYESGAPVAYRKVGMAKLRDAVAAAVETEGFMEEITEEEFDEIFPPSGSPSTSSY